MEYIEFSDVPSSVTPVYGLFVVGQEIEPNDECHLWAQSLAYPGTDNSKFIIHKMPDKTMYLLCMSMVYQEQGHAMAQALRYQEVAGKFRVFSLTVS
jgi:hypothetical protein